jgi:hypothetical protein
MPRGVAVPDDVAVRNGVAVRQLGCARFVAYAIGFVVIRPFGILRLDFPPVGAGLLVGASFRHRVGLPLLHGE